MVVFVESVLDILDCVYFNRMDLYVENILCVKILDFFVWYMDVLKKNLICWDKLRCLLFYCGLDDEFKLLLEFEIIVLFLEMFIDGLNVFEL